jgi:DUF1365 family protein
LQLPREKPDSTKNTRQHITEYLKENGVNIGKGRIMLLTNLCTLGYQFNPVSFYFCYNEQGEVVCSIVEVCKHPYWRSFSFEYYQKFLRIALY